MPIPRIAASTYLNSFPLCYSLLYGSQRERCEFVGDLSPARCADLLRSGEVDGALIPSIEAQRIPDLVLVSHVAVAAREEVRSVVLVSRRPLAEAHSVALDRSSRTAAALTRILFHKFLKQEVLFQSATANLEAMLEAADVALLIGDPALQRTCNPGDLRVYDLARLWRIHTDLPFVFAVWAIRRGSAEACASIDFSAARDEGLANLEQIIEHRSRELDLSLPYLRRYLTECISYDLLPEHLRGLRLFYRLAQESGIIDRIMPVSFTDQTERQEPDGAQVAFDGGTPPHVK